MIRTFKKTVALLLLSIFFVSAIQLNVKPVQATSDASTIYVSTYGQGEPSTSYAIDTADMIAYLFGEHMGPYNYILTSTGSGTTSSNILSTASSTESQYDYVAFFHYGHWATVSETAYYLTWVPPNSYIYVPTNVSHYTFSDYNGNHVFDSDIYDQTSQGKHYFVFLWTCVNAVTDGYYDADDYPWYLGTGAVGMPFAWTQHTDLSSNGYTDPDNTAYTFIGFYGTSKFLNDTASGTHSYADFAADFYIGALSSSDLTINQALDYASTQIWGYGTTFNQSDVYSYLGLDMQGNYNEPSGMKVWGNGNNILPH